MIEEKAHLTFKRFIRIVFGIWEQKTLIRVYGQGCTDKDEGR